MRGFTFSFAALCIGLLGLSGCQSIPTSPILAEPVSFYPSSKNTRLLQSLNLAQPAIISSMRLDEPFDKTCRLVSEISFVPDAGIAEFLRRGLNQELQAANYYDDEGIKIAGILNHISFETKMSATDWKVGYWQMWITLVSSNGHRLEVKHRRFFNSDIEPISACAKANQALVPSIQATLGKAMQDPNFAKLMAKSQTLNLNLQMDSLRR